MSSGSPMNNSTVTLAETRTTAWRSCWILWGARSKKWSSGRRMPFARAVTRMGHPATIVTWLLLRTLVFAPRICTTMSSKGNRLVSRYMLRPFRPVFLELILVGRTVAPAHLRSALIARTTHATVAVLSTLWKHLLHLDQNLSRRLVNTRPLKIQPPHWKAISPAESLHQLVQQLIANQDDTTP